MSVTDAFGRTWPTPADFIGVEHCGECLQPDNCGDCNHEPLSDDEAVSLGASL